MQIYVNQKPDVMAMEPRKDHSKELMMQPGLRCPEMKCSLCREFIGSM